MKFQKLATVAVIGVLGFSGLAASDGTPADNLASCSAIDGVFTDAGANSTRVRTCVVTVAGGSRTVAASHKKQSWTVDVTSPSSVTTHRLAAGSGYSASTTGGTGGDVVTGCRNHQGNAISDFETNANCVPA